MTAETVIQAWDQADPDAIHPLRRVSEDAYWDSGKAQADMLASVIPDGAKVLDFGCGDGRVAIPMAGLGYDVTAVDSSQRMLDRLTERERDVLGLMAEGLSNQAIRERLFLSESAISKHTTSLFGKLGIVDDDASNRRVLAVLTYLGLTGS